MVLFLFQKADQFVLKLMIIRLFIHDDVRSSLDHLELRALRQIVKGSVDQIIVEIRIVIPADNRSRHSDLFEIDQLI